MRALSAVMLLGVVALLGCGEEPTEPRALPPVPRMSYQRACSCEGPDILSPASAPAGYSSELRSRWEVRARFAYVDAARIRAATAPDSLLRLRLFDDVCLDVQSDGIDTQHPTSWKGRVLGAPDSSVRLDTLADGSVVGSVGGLGPSYQIRPVAEGVHRVSEMDTSGAKD